MTVTSGNLSSKDFPSSTYWNEWQTVVLPRYSSPTRAASISLIRLQRRSISLSNSSATEMTFCSGFRVLELVPAEVLSALRDNAVPGELDAVASQARALREWFRGFVDKYRGKRLPRNALKKLEPLNQVLARDEEFGQIVGRDRRYDHEAPSDLKWEVRKRWRSPKVLLIPIARAMAELVCSEDFSDIKACEGHTCTLFFLDRTPGRARRWCSMAICGNRAKQAAHRKKTKRNAQPRARK